MTVCLPEKDYVTRGNVSN